MAREGVACCGHIVYLHGMYTGYIANTRTACVACAGHPPARVPPLIYSRLPGYLHGMIYTRLPALIYSACRGYLHGMPRTRARRALLHGAPVAHLACRGPLRPLM